MKAKELKNKDRKELEKMLGDLKKKLSDARFNVSGNKLKNVKEFGNMKRDVARILTMIKELEKKHA